MPETGDYACRLATLRSRLESLESVAVAFSGGVDSGVLLHAAHAALGGRAAGVIADSPSLPRAELAEARELAARIGVRLHEVPTAELADADYRANRGDRCYYCKSALFEAMTSWARTNGFAVLAFGEITDDLADDRPGARAAAEFGVTAPLRQAGFSKEDVRRYAREHHLPVADKPAAACLASRIPVGREVTAADLARVERAEAALKALGLRQVRVRHLGDRARLEVAEGEIDLARSRPGEVAAALAGAGFGSYELAVYLPPARRTGALPGA